MALSSSLEQALSSRTRAHSDREVCISPEVEGVLLTLTYDPLFRGFG